MSATTVAPVVRSAPTAARTGRPLRGRPTRPTHPVAVRTPLRLTVRGRLVLLATLALLAFALVSLGQVAVQAGGPDAGSPVVSRTWVVQPGETLWSIAEELDTDADPRETVARIVAMNDLPDSAVLVGQELQVPA